ncbi:MAG: hypothetical protein AAGC77_03560 [Pseudomonadota bacterium]
MAGEKTKGKASKTGVLSWASRIVSPKREPADKKRAHPPANKPAFSPGDPTRGVFAASESDAYGAQLPLASELMDAAERVAEAPKEIEAAKRKLIAGLGARAEGEVMLAIQAVRVLIGIVWLAVAIWLYNGALVAAADNATTLANTMPVEDAMILARTFFIVSAVGLAAAFFMWALSKASGNTGNRRVRALAEDLGRQIAFRAQEYQGQLNSIYESFSAKGAPREAISVISRAHIVALEACYLLQAYGFIADNDGNAAREGFKAFVRPKPAQPSPMGVFGLGLALGLFMGAAYVWMNFVPKAEPTGPATPLAIAQYPWAYFLLLFGGVIYAAASVLVTAVAGVFTAGALSRAREDALDSLRSAYTQSGAPRRVDLADQIRRLSDVFAANIQWRSATGVSHDEPKTNQPDRESTDFGAAAGESPSWRRPDSGASFVETGFQAAPKSWRVDAGAKLQDGEPGSKRGLGKLKKR